MVIQIYDGGNFEFKMSGVKSHLNGLTIWVGFLNIVSHCGLSSGVPEDL